MRKSERGRLLTNSSTLPALCTIVLDVLFVSLFLVIRIIKGILECNYSSLPL